MICSEFHICLLKLIENYKCNSIICYLLFQMRSVGVLNEYDVQFFVFVNLF